MSPRALRPGEVPALAALTTASIREVVERGGQRIERFRMARQLA